MKMKALSVRPPWSWLLIKGYKPVENRNRKTNIRGEIFIHQAKTFDWDALPFIAKNFPRIFTEVIDEFQISPLKQYYILPDKLGGIIGKVDLYNSVTGYRSVWFSGPNGYLMRLPRELPFFKVPGMPGFFEVDYPDSLLIRSNDCKTPVKKIEVL